MPRQRGSSKIRAAYAFLKQMETEGRTFSLADLMTASGWAKTTAKANLTKKLASVLKKSDDGYQCVGVNKLTEAAFCRLCSQNSALATDLLRPELAPKVEGYVNKARDAALAAVQHYNNPTAQFRCANFIVLMVIAFTALLHAIFERDGVDYVERKNDGTAKTTGDGIAMLWDVLHCVNHYEQGKDTAMSANLKLLVKIRHYIEHQYMPQLDADINGHCQSMLMNFEQVLIKEFTAYYALNTSLVMALQFSTERTLASVAALRRFQSAEYDAIKQYIHDFEAGLPDNILADPAFAFRVWLVPKTANSIKKSDHCIDFVSADRLTPEVLAEFDRQVVAVKRVERDVRNSDLLLPRDVAARVAQAIGRKFAHSSHHSRAWKHHKVRPDRSAGDPTLTDTRYCIWDAPTKQYLYTPEWVALLIEEYKEEGKYNAVFAPRTQPLDAS